VVRITPRRKINANSASGLLQTAYGKAATTTANPLPECRENGFWPVDRCAFTDCVSTPHWSSERTWTSRLKSHKRLPWLLKTTKWHKNQPQLTWELHKKNCCFQEEATKNHTVTEEGNRY